jgi:hypothetical protein
MVVWKENIGVVFMSESPSTCSCTWCMDTSDHFTQEFNEDGTIKIKIVRSSENDSNSFNQNLQSGVILKTKE